jgi:hypothetical protein
MPADDSVRSVLLIHGGLWEDIGGYWFWDRTGVSEALTRRGLTVIVPDRLRRGTSWTAEAAHIASAPLLPDGPLHPRAAVDALLRLLPSAVELPGCPEPPRPAFAPHLELLADELAAFARG